MFEPSRRMLGVSALSALAIPAFSWAGETAAIRSATRAFELTFLKAQDGDTTSLARFITLNWFEMDRIAVERGIITEYRMLISNEADQPWDVLVIVGYPSEAGYSGVTAEFEAIRTAHATATVDGKTLGQLGAIVSSRRLIPG
ncbi:MULTISPECIES: hypothetical protein [unclassified Sphingomonas]|jgi:hypothetical protein|uniref:hypothetical protein n=1 Tax=unclassified Sphingomonas TaxID=196159 RepID=UPI00053E0B54|nr:MULTISPECIES: hypothetical protein [unclassified Sphingomonas]